MKSCTNYETSKRFYGEKTAIKIAQRIKEISSFDSVEQLVQFSIGRCHKLKGNKSNQFAMDLDGPYRIIFKKVDDKIQMVKILSIEDYH